VRGDRGRRPRGAFARAVFLATTTAFLVTATAFAAALDAPRLERELDRLANGTHGRIGACVADASTVVCVNGDQRSSLQSVMKLVVAVAALEQVDAGRWRLDEAVTVRREDLSVFVQPIAKLVGPDGYRTNIADLVRRAIVDSDSAATDVLIARLGGVKAVQAVLDRHHVTGVRIDRDERHLQTETSGLGWRPEYVDPDVFDRAREAVPKAKREAAFRKYQADVRDTATPRGMVSLLQALAEGRLLSAESTTHLLRVMTETVTFPDRLKAGLAPGWTLGHKTGSSGGLGGVTVATNDVGVLTAPDGNRLSVAVFVSDSRAEAAERAAVIAGVARAAIASWGSGLEL
jgi:beta-lactamase class A